LGGEEQPGDLPARALTVIIVSYRSSALLAACLRSLDAQVGIDPVNVIVVDNHSADGTVEMIRRNHPAVRLVTNSHNVGFGRACNQALALARPGDVLMLNPDTLVPPDGLSRAVDALRARPGVGVLGVKLVRVDGSPDHAARREIPTPFSGLAYMLRLHRIPGSRRFAGYVRSGSYDDETEVGAVSGAFMLVRGQALAEVGGFDERFWMYGEDLDWCLRFRAAGWGICYWPGVTVVHIKGGTSGAVRSVRLNWAFHHAMWLFYRKHQAATYGPLVSSMVGLAILARFALSETVSSLRRLHPRSSGGTRLQATLDRVGGGVPVTDVTDRAIPTLPGQRTRVLSIVLLLPGPAPTESVRAWARWIEETGRVGVRMRSGHGPPPPGVLSSGDVRRLVQARDVDVVVVVGSGSRLGRRPWWWRARGLRVVELVDGPGPSTAARLTTGDVPHDGDPARSADVAARDLLVARLARSAARPGAGLTDGPGVSVVVTVLNEEHTLDPLLDALLPQLRPDDELIVVDGGSTDGTWDRLSARATIDGRLHPLRRPGTNISAGRNAGIAVARHTVIACTDAGCDPAPDWLAAIRAPFGEPDGPALVASVPEIVGDRPLERAQALACYPHPRDYERPTLLVRAWGKAFGQVFTPDLPFARSLAFTVPAWREAGGFPERLPWVEDGVFGLAVAQHHTCVGTVDARVRWRQRGSLRSTARMYFRYGIGAADSGSTMLVLRDVARAGAYAVGLGCAVLAPRRSAPVLAAGAALYYSLPLARVTRERAGLSAAALVPLAMAVKDLSKVAGAVAGHRRRLAAARGTRDR